MLKKYKHLTKIRDLRLIPSRVLKFKKSKWTKLKIILSKKLQTISTGKKKVIFKYSPRYPIGFKRNSSLLKSYRKFAERVKYLKFNKFRSKLKIFDKFKVFVNKGRFSYLSSLSKDRVQSHLKLKYLLNQNNMITKRQCKDRDIYIKNIYKDKFCIRGVLSSYYFFNSLNDIKDKIKAGLILINGKNLSKYDFLKKGDIIKVNSLALPLKKNIKAIFSNYSLPSHLEADIYSQNVVLIKDLSMTSQEDFHLISLEYINAQKI